MVREFFLTRHSIKPKGEDVEDENYKGISKKGALLAKESAKDILEYVKKSPDNAIIFLGGASDEIRTKSTAAAYGAALKEQLKGNEDYIVITKDDVYKKGGKHNSIAQVKKIIKDNPDKKIIIDIPMFMKEFSLKQKGWFTKEGKPSPYLAKLLEKGGGNEEKAMEYWFDHGGDIEGLEGPSPLRVAKDYEKGMNRLERFAKKQFGDRPYVTGIVGHSLEADTFLTYLAGEGKIDSSIYQKLSSGKGMIKETELASVRVGPEFSAIAYRGNETKGKTLDNILKVLGISSLLASVFSSSSITGNVIGITESYYLGAIFFILAVIFGVAIISRKKK